jgi:hypothetical protein
MLDAFQSASADSVLETGMGFFLNPPLVDLAALPYSWTFMRPVLTIDTAADQREYELPDNFERFIGDFTYDADLETYPSIKLTTEERLRRLFTDHDATAPPQLAAVKIDDGDGSAPQRQILILHPTPDDTYKLRVRYEVTYIPLSESRPYPPGGPAHYETIKAACLAAAELRKEKKYGPMYNLFLDRLRSSIATDLRRGGEHYGYLGDSSTHGAPWLSDLRGNGLLNPQYSDTTYNGST